MSTIYIYLIKGTNVRKNVLIFFFIWSQKRRTVFAWLEPPLRYQSIHTSKNYSLMIKILCFINVSQYNTCIDDQINEHIQFACKPADTS